MAAFAAHSDPDGARVLVAVVDNAGWYLARRPVVPPNIRFHVLPLCTSELLPVEPFRALVREVVAYDTFERPGWNGK